MIANPAPITRPIEPPQTPYETLREELRQHEEKDVCHLSDRPDGTPFCGASAGISACVFLIDGSVLSACTCGRNRCSRCAEVWFGL